MPLNKIKKEYCFIRHAEAVLTGEDETKPLSEKGRREAKLLADRLRSAFDLIVSSCAKRAVETTEIIQVNNHSKATIEIVPELYLPKKDVDRQAVIYMLDNLGPVSISCFREHDPIGAWKRYSEEAFKALEKVIERYASRNILVIAHANIINELGLRISTNANELLFAYFDPCDGFQISWEGKVKLQA